MTTTETPHLDAEIAAMTTVALALGPLDPDACERVLSWAYHRHVAAAPPAGPRTHWLDDLPATGDLIHVDGRDVPVTDVTVDVDVSDGGLSWSLVAYQVPDTGPEAIEDGGARPEVVCLCGSTRFIDAFDKANLDLTLAGKIVLSIGCVTSSDSDLGIDADTKVALDELHRRKIDLADRILVLNVGGYIGESTGGEIAYASTHGKPVEYLEPEHGPSVAEVFPAAEAVEG